MLHYAAVTTVQAQTQNRIWSVVGAPKIVKADVSGIPLRGDPTTIAAMLIAISRQAGIVGLTAVVNEQAHVIQLIEAKTKVSGDLKDYIRSGSASIIMDDPLVAQDAKANGGVAYIKVGTARKGYTPVTATIKNKHPAFTLSAGVSSFGPRYAGSDVTNQAINFSYNGYTANAGFIEGIPTWTPNQSMGGYYYGTYGSLTKVTPYGIFGITGQFSKYREGGVSNSLDIIGKQALFGLTYALPMASGVTYNAGMYDGFQHEGFGKLTFLNGYQSFYALNVGLNVKLATGYNNGVMDINGQIYSGETRSSGILLGNQGHGWQMGQLNAELYQYLPYHTSLQLKTGAQYATGQTPEQEYFILGGEWRGDSYYAGQAATPSGIYGGVRFFTPRIRTNTGWLRTFSAHPFIGVNGAEGTPMVGGRLETASVDIGSKFKLTKYLFGETGYAWSIDNQGPHIPKGRLFFTLTGNYI